MKRQAYLERVGVSESDKDNVFLIQWLSRYMIYIRGLFHGGVSGFLVSLIFYICYEFYYLWP